MLRSILLKLWVLISGIAVVTFLVGCGVSVPGAITGSGKAETRDFNLSGFTGVQASNAFTIQVSRADTTKVQVTADDNLWNSLDISISESTLHLRAKPGVNIINSTLKATITLPAISSLDMSGGLKSHSKWFQFRQII